MPGPPRHDRQPADDRAHDRAQFRAFVEANVSPYADGFDQVQSIPPGTLRAVADQGHFGAALPVAYGGAGMDMVTLGELHEEVGRGCSSLRSLLTVHTMASMMTARWAGEQTRREWLPRMAAGDAVAAFCLTEPEAGSDAASITMTARRSGEGYLLDGIKRWITGGQIADLLLVFARTERGPTALLVEADRAGIERIPIDDMLGTRASLLAEVRFRDCWVPRSAVIATEGAGLLVATTALDLGRYSVACGCVGILQACLDACVSYTAKRSQGGAVLREHQLVRRLISEMVAQLSAARLLCRHAGELKDQGDPATVTATCIAKYVAASSAVRVAGDAVQLLGAHGCSTSASVSRYFRDAKIMEIIEGSTQIQQLMIAEDAYRRGVDELLPVVGGRSAA